jgi:hypothetical protein
VDYQYRPVRKTTAEYLDKEYRQFARTDTVPDGAVFTIGTKSYAKENGRWTRMVPVKPPQPEFRAVVVYGEFTVPRTGHNFVAVKYPTKSNWNKTVAPAVVRMLRRLTGCKRNDWLGTDNITYEKNADEVAVFNRLKGPAKFVLRNNEFACVWKGTPRKNNPPRADRQRDT